MRCHTHRGRNYSFVLDTSRQIIFGPRRLRCLFVLGPQAINICGNRQSFCRNRGHVITKLQCGVCTPSPGRVLEVLRKLGKLYLYKNWKRIFVETLVLSVTFRLVFSVVFHLFHSQTFPIPGNPVWERHQGVRQSACEGAPPVVPL